MGPGCLDRRGPAAEKSPPGRPPLSDFSHSSTRIGVWLRPAAAARILWLKFTLKFDP
jgi:hypothetical protein